MTGPSAQLAAFASGLQYDEIPAAAVEQAKRSALDTIGCALHGSTLPWGGMLRDVIAAEGGAEQALIWGTSQRTSRTQAALANATAAHSFELDDIHMGGMIHPGALTLGAALAVGEHELDGKTLLASIVAGTEVGARVGMAVGTGHFRAGYHPQGTVGVFAAAASAGRATGLDPARLQHVLGVAGSQAAGLMAAQEGAMVKRLHSGRACQSGVLAALLAARGFTGIPDVLEAEFGGFVGTMGGDSVDPALLTAGLGERWETEQLGFKAYASCAAAHTSLEVARLLRLEHDLTAGDVASVTIHASSHATVHCGWRYEPTGVTAAQMSIPYGTARMLVDGSVAARHFTDSAIAEPEVLDLASRVSVVPDPAIDALGPMQRYTIRVVIETRGGKELSGEASDRPGSPAHPLTTAQLEEKFTDLAAPVVGSAAAQRLVELVGGLEALAEVTELTGLLAPGSQGGRS